MAEFREGRGQEARPSSPMRERMREQYSRQNSFTPPGAGQNSYAPPTLAGSRADGSYVPQQAGFGGIQSYMSGPMPGARPGYEYQDDPRGGPPLGTVGDLRGGPPAPSYSPSGPNDGGYGFDRMASLGTWSELIAGGIVDTPYIEQEAERRKLEIDRQMDNQLAQLESQCQEQSASIKQQAEYHTQMAEKQIEGHKRQHLAQVARQAELQSYAIVQKAEMEKGRLGQEAYRALSQQSEREKAAILHAAMRKAEDVWRQSQRQLMEEAQRAKANIDVEAQRQAHDIEKEAREAVSRVYVSPQAALGNGSPFGLPSGASPMGSFSPPPTATMERPPGYGSREY